MKHPECDQDEFYIGNWTDATWHHVKWSTRRRGDVAYINCGNLGIMVSPDPDMFPGFIKRHEALEKHPEFLERLEKMQFVGNL